MKTESNTDPSRETSRLLSELDQAIDHSSVMRDIIGKYERLYSIESITGPSSLTRSMRSEIRAMESRLRQGQKRRGPNTGTAASRR